MDYLRSAKVLKSLNVATFVVVAVVSAIGGSSAVFGGNSVASVSRKNPTFITPAPYAFSIWSIIYFFLAGFNIYQALPIAPPDIVFEGIGPLWIINGLHLVAWIFAWNYEVLWLSEIIMLGIFISFAALYLRIGQYWSPALSWSDYLLIYVPFSLYGGWITIAAIINTYVVSTSLEGGPDGYYAYSGIVGLAIAGVLATIVSGFLERRDGVFAAVIVWGLIGIWKNQAFVPVIRDVSMFFAGWLVGLILIVDVGYRILEWHIHGNSPALI